MHPFIKISGLLKRGVLHLVGGAAIGLAGGKESILPTSIAIAGKEIKDPHPAENRNRWILKSVLDWAAWTGGTIFGAIIRKKIWKKNKEVGMPTRKRGETTKAYVKRAIPIIRREHPEKTMKAVVGQAYGMARTKKKTTKRSR